jgi:non-ribosomal peptide synthetase component F
LFAFGEGEVIEMSAKWGIATSPDIGGSAIAFTGEATAMYESDVGADQHDRLGVVDPEGDQSGRCGVGPRLERLFEARCDWLASLGQSDHQVAVDSRYATLTYHELDCLANQLARCLLARGARPGDRIGLLFDHGADSYIAMLAVLKIRAAYVPLDAGFPVDRIGYITAAAGVSALLTVTSLAPRLPVRERSNVEVVFVDAATEEISRYAHTRLGTLDRGGPPDDVAAVIYPSSSGGRPHGVEITHASIGNFALMAAKIYGISARDRVYEGLSTAVDFSAEGIWVAWTVGATLVPKSAGPALCGHELRQFLAHNDVTALYCPPALLATLNGELPELKFVLVSGEACPSDLLARWRRPGRRVLSVYGQTEATAPATTMAVQATADIVQVSDGHVTVHMTPDDYEHTPDNQLRRLLID